MTPRQHKEETEKLITDWHIPLRSRKRWTLRGATETMEGFKLDQSDVPLIIKLVENPKYDIGLFAGNVDLKTHDCIHVLLGRGLLPKDEAFVIGYTMGSTKKMPRWRRNLFMFCSKHLYPEGYRFGEEERFVFNMGVALGSVNQVDLSVAGKHLSTIWLDLPVTFLRKSFYIDTELLKSYYRIEKKLFPNSAESQRLL
jgi:hypothetical protein